MVGARRHLQSRSLVTSPRDWVDTKPYSEAGIFVQLTFSGLVIMQHVCSQSTHCSHVAGMVTKNPTYFRIFLFANISQCHQKGFQAGQRSWKNSEVKMHLLRVWYFLRGRRLHLSDLNPNARSCPTSPSPPLLLCSYKPAPLMFL